MQTNPGIAAIEICDDAAVVARVYGCNPRANQLANVMAKAPELASWLRWALITLSDAHGGREMQLSDAQLDALRRAWLVLDAAQRG